MCCKLASKVSLLADPKHKQMECMTELSSAILDAPVEATYICTNEVLSDSLERCISANCSIRESLSPFLYHQYLADF